jgi:hypothetical protein
MELCLQKFREQLLQREVKEIQESLKPLQFEQHDHFVRNPILIFQLQELLLPMLFQLRGPGKKVQKLPLLNRLNSLR